MRPASSPPRFLETRIGSRFTPGIIALLVLFAATYLIGLLVGVLAPGSGEQWMARYLVLRPIEAIGPRPYQLLSAAVMMTSFISLLLLGLLLWSLGSAIEQSAGTRRFVSWMAGASVVAALVAALIGRLGGLLWPPLAAYPVILNGQPVFMAVLVAFSHYYGSLPVRMWGIGEPVSGRGLAYFFIGIGLFAKLLGQAWLELVADLAAGGFMFWVLRGSFSALRQRLGRLISRRRRGLEVLDGGLRGKPNKSEPRWLN